MGKAQPSVAVVRQCCSYLPSARWELLPGHNVPQGPPDRLSSHAYAEDFDAAWTFIRDTYAYFDPHAVDWEQVRVLLRPRVAEVRDRTEFINLLEELVEHLCDHHAHLGTNTASSPRLVPSGADLRAAHRLGDAVITDVRAGSDAEASGLRPGMLIVSIGGSPAAAAVDDRLPRAVARDNVAARDWALRTLLAGRHGAAVHVEVQSGKGPLPISYDPGRWSRPEAPLTAAHLDADIGYVRLHDSLGQHALIPAWDAALARLRETDGLVLDPPRHAGWWGCGYRTPVAGPFRVVHAAVSAPREARPKPSRLAKNMDGESEAAGTVHLRRAIGRAGGPVDWEHGEGVAIALDGMKRADVFGSPMAGLRGAIETLTLKHSKIPVRVPAERLYHIDGIPREAFVPPFPVETKPSSDAVLTAAVEWLLHR